MIRNNYDMSVGLINHRTTRCRPPPVTGYNSCLESKFNHHRALCESRNALIFVSYEL